MNVEANDSAKNASTFEQMDTTIASAIIATIDSAGFAPIASSASRGISTCTAPASADPMTSAGITARSSITNCASVRRHRPPGSCVTSSHVSRKRSVSRASGDGCREYSHPIRLAIAYPPRMRATRMPSLKPNAWCVVRITMGFTIGAAIRNVSVSGTEKPRISRPRANGTLPHSQTGTIMPSSDSTARRAHARRGIHRSMTPGGTHTCTTIDSTTPRATNGSDSMSTLIASVSPSWARVGRDAGNSVGASQSMRNRPAEGETHAEPQRRACADGRGAASVIVA